MKVTYNWLKDFVEIKIPARALADKLTMAGLEVVSLEQKYGDFVFEIEVTSNRPDWLSVVGVAREVAAITGSRVKGVGSRINKKSLHPKRYTLPPVSIKIEDKKDCPLYTAKIIKDVKVGPSPQWLKNRLELVGCRSVNNIVDITNYILFETGHPLHAFDLDKLAGNAIIVRRAKDNEKIITIDGQERKLNPEILVIADPQNPLAAAGIMGGLNTEVTESTQNILLEGAYFDPLIIRRGARILGLSTDSSYRFERTVDIETVDQTSWRVVELMIEMAGGKFVDAQAAGVAKQKSRPAISLDVAKVNRILNLKLSTMVIKKILISLGFTVKGATAKTLKILVPSFRPDVKIEEDLIEEIARIYGFDKIPTSIPHIRPDIGENIPSLLKLEKKARQILLGQGLNEAITYSLISQNLLAEAKFISIAPTQIENPLSTEQEILRPTLLPMLLNVVSYNLNRQEPDIRLFELGKIFFEAQEKLTLGLIMTGLDTDFCLPQAKIKLETNIFHLKGIVQTLLESLGIENLDIVSADYDFFAPASAASIKIKDKEVGFLGKLAEGLKGNFSLKTKQEIFFAQIILEDLLEAINLKQQFRPLNLYPSVYRDISLVIDKTINFAHIKEAVLQRGRPHIQEIRIVDYYHGEQIPLDKKGLTLSLRFQSPDKTLKDDEVNNLKEKICLGLTDSLGASIR